MGEPNSSSHDQPVALASSPRRQMPTPHAVVDPLCAQRNRSQQPVSETAATMSRVDTAKRARDGPSHA